MKLIHGPVLTCHIDTKLTTILVTKCKWNNFFISTFLASAIFILFYLFYIYIYFIHVYAPNFVHVRLCIW